MPVYRLHPSVPVFPHPLPAGEDGLIAIDGSMDPDWLLAAYSFGLFPWYSEDQPIMWWFPDPRCVLFPRDFVPSKSLKRTMRKGTFRVTRNEQFDAVIRACAEMPRHDQEGTWIMPEMIDAYTRLHEMGYAQSIEVWDSENNLVGGLYGIKLGKIFFGESMFSRQSDASKVGFAHLVSRLIEEGVVLIDCQQDTPHLRSLGASLISAEEFWGYVKGNLPHIMR